MRAEAATRPQANKSQGHEGIAQRRAGNLHGGDKRHSFVETATGTADVWGERYV